MTIGEANAKANKEKREYRIEEAKKQFEDFNKKKLEGKNLSADEIEERIIKFIESSEFNKTGKKKTLIISVPMSYTDKDSFKKMFEDLGLPIGCKKYFYVWIGFNEDDCPVVVGKTSFWQDFSSLGDLFESFSIYGSVLKHITLNILTTAEEKNLLDELDKKLKKHICRAIVIPTYVSTDADAKKIEYIIGNFLLEEKINILDEWSHKKDDLSIKKIRQIKASNND